MLYSYQEVLEKYGTRNSIEEAIKRGEIYKLKNNVYSDKKYINPIVIVSKKYPSGIITMDSAFYYYNLTDVIPQKVYLATNRNSNKIKDENIVQIFMFKDILDKGKTEIDINGNKVNIYDRERLLIELIRKRASIPFDYYKEIIENYRKISNELDMYKIEEYVSLFKNEVNLFDILQREVF
ncbi:MAG: nucleotidyltransferase [Bacilli bacterium]|nr:nucleotidyltransferase [Bacilli bacterium]